MARDVPIQSLKIKKLLITITLILFVIFIGIMVVLTITKTPYDKISEFDSSEINEAVTRQLVDNGDLSGNLVIETIHKFKEYPLQITVITKNGVTSIYNWNIDKKEVMPTYDVSTDINTSYYIYDRGTFKTELEKNEGGEYQSIVFSQQ